MFAIPTPRISVMRPPRARGDPQFRVMLPVLPFPSTAIRYVVPATAVNVTRLVGTAGLRFSSSLVTTGNKLLTLEPVYTANSVSSGVWKRLALPSVLNVTGPLLDGVQLYQT